MTESEFIAAVAREGLSIVDESGAISGFDSLQWAHRFVRRPLRRFGGKSALDFISEPGGLERVIRALRAASVSDHNAGIVSLRRLKTGATAIAA